MSAYENGHVISEFAEAWVLARGKQVATSTSVNTVEALLTDTLVSGQLYLRPPCLKPRFNSHTNSVFLRSRKRTFP